MRGQVGLEYLIIVGVLLLMVGVLTKYYENFSSDAGTDVIISASLDNFERAVKNVYALGIPARRTVKISLPENINSSRTMINSSLVQVSYYNNLGSLVDVMRFFDFNLVGEFPNQSGNYELVVYSLGAGGVGVNSS